MISICDELGCKQQHAKSNNLKRYRKQVGNGLVERDEPIFAHLTGFSEYQLVLVDKVIGSSQKASEEEHK